MTIGERIKERRKQLGISVDELAEQLGKNRATIYRYESSDIEKLPTTVLEPLAEALHTTPAYLMGWSSPNENTEVLYGNFIKKLREVGGLSQEELAEKAQLELEAVQMFENNAIQPGAEAFSKILDVIGIPLANLKLCGFMDENIEYTKAHYDKVENEQKEKIADLISKLNLNGLKRIRLILEDYSKIPDFLKDE